MAGCRNTWAIEGLSFYFSKVVAIWKAYEPLSYKSTSKQCKCCSRSYLYPWLEGGDWTAYPSP